MKIIKNCLECGKNFVSGRKDRTFCSDRCADRRRRTQRVIHKGCMNCKGEFVTHLADRMFCSNKCSLEYQKAHPVNSKTCEHCGKPFMAQRPTRRFCSVSCANRSEWSGSKTRNCLQCGKSFPLRSAADANRKHCSRACAKKHNTKKIRTWQIEHPEKMEEYRKRRVAKNPGHNKERSRKYRLESIRLLGGCCCVCGVTNQNWLHVDYIPTNKASPYRHPRHLAFIKRHLADFRLLCANHHYELTLTGRIEGTEIVQ